MNQSTDRILPYDVNAEAAVLSAMMLDNVAASTAISELEENYFYRTAHRLIFQTMKELYRDSIEIDLVTLSARLQPNNQIEKVGGTDYLNKISDFVLSTANL